MTPVLGNSSATLGGEMGFVIEQIELGRRAVLEQIDDALGSGRKIRVARNDGLGRGGNFRRQKGRERGDADAGGATTKKVPPRL